MVTGQYVKCSTDGCGHEYRIRFNVGNVFPQKGTFKCKTCGSNLSYGWNKNRKNILDGIKIITHSDSATVQNLHPELPIDPARESDPYYFPSPEYLVRYGHERNGDFATFRKAQISMATFKIKLDELEPNLRYLKERRWSLLDKKYGKNEATTEKKILKEAMEVSRLFIEGKWQTLYRDALSQVEHAKRASNFNALKQYFTNRKDELLIEKLYSVIQLYHKNYHELLRIRPTNYVFCNCLKCLG